MDKKLHKETTIWGGTPWGGEIIRRSTNVDHHVMHTLT